MADVTREALGRWEQILPALGVPVEVLTKKHKSCPGCGGKDRFRYVGGERGEWFCGQGGDTTGGDGFSLLMHVHGWPFKDAARAVEKVLGISNDWKGPTYDLNHDQGEEMLLWCLAYKDNKKKGWQTTAAEDEKYNSLSTALTNARIAPNVRRNG